MAGWPDPSTPERDPQAPPDPDSPFDEPPFERPPFDEDPDAQRAPGAGHEEPGSAPSPMQARRQGGAEIVMDAPGFAREAVGNDNIREGKVGGVMGPPHASGGQGQGG
jgi:hypothetical protein